MRQDRYGLPLTTASDGAAAAYREGVDLLLAAWPGAADALDRAVADDPEFALAHAARARLHQMFGQAPAARAQAVLARTHAAHASDRERRHVAIVAAAVEGRPAEALAGAEQHDDEFTRDALVLSLLLGAYGLYAFSGRADHDAARVAICERHARSYGEDWWFLTYLGWSHTEAGNVGAGRTVTERAIALRRENGHAAHALAHAMFEQGDAGAADAFLTDWLPAYSRATQLNAHLSWHHALIALERDDIEAAIRIYEDRIRPTVSQAAPLSTLADGPSLLWRAALAGRTGLEPYWRELADYAEATFPRAGLGFVDVHAVLVAAATDHTALERRVGELEALHAQGRLPPGAAVAGLCRGMRAFASGDYEATVRLLEPLMGEVVRLGGSHAQRELFEDTLVVACLRSGPPDKARALIDQRLHRRPSARDERWLREAGQTLQ
jgi:hypothetical protein